MIISMQAKEVPSLIGFVIAIFGICLLIAGLHLKGKNKRCSAQVQGTLTEIRKIRKRNSYSESNRYYYSYSVDGQDFTLWADEGSSSTEAREVGDAYTIWYNPSKPKDALAYHYDNNKFLNVCTVIGIVLIIGGFLFEFWWLILFLIA
jgi:hypothetical protein